MTPTDPVALAREISDKLRWCTDPSVRHRLFLEAKSISVVLADLVEQLRAEHDKWLDTQLNYSIGKEQQIEELEARLAEQASVIQRLRVKLEEGSELIYRLSPWVAETSQLLHTSQGEAAVLAEDETP